MQQYNRIEQLEKVKKEEQYIIRQSPEISVGENTRWVKRFRAFPALENKNYRKYFIGQFISVIGTWLQIVAQGWLVLELTHSAFWIGLVAALATVPSLLFSLVGGVIIDGFRKKKIILITQTANMVLALLLGVLTLTEQVTVINICMIAFLMGTVNALDAPARQTFVPLLVRKEQLASAIALNSGIFNAARATGPALAGLLIAFVGTGFAFILNGLSFLAVILALRLIEFKEKPSARVLRPLKAIQEGLKYSFTHPIIRVLLIFTGVVSIFGWSYSTMMPYIARNVFHLDARGLGYFYSATGLGSLLATYLVGAYSRKFPPVLFMAAGNTLFALSLIAFSFTTSFAAAIPLLFTTGLGLLLQSAMMNTIIQSLVKSDLRGRVMSIYVLMFVGFAPLGNLEVGFLTEHLGARYAISINALIVLLIGAVLFRYRGAIRKAYGAYKRAHARDVLSQP